MLSLSFFFIFSSFVNAAGHWTKSVLVFISVINSTPLVHIWQTRWHHLVAPSPLLEVLQGCQVWEYLRKPSALSTFSASGHSASRKVGATCTVFSIVLHKIVTTPTQSALKALRRVWRILSYYLKKILKKVHLASRPTQVERRTNREPAEYLNTWRYNAIFVTRIAMYLNTNKNRLCSKGLCRGLAGFLSFD